MSSQSQAAVSPLTVEQQRLVEEHLPLVNAIARGWRNRCRTTIEFAELVQVGSLGLIDAARRFEPSRGTPFAAMAAGRIRGSICDHFRELDPLTRDRRKAVRRLESATNDLRTKLGREPRENELADAFGKSARALESAHDDATSLAAGWARPHDAGAWGESAACFELSAAAPSALDELLRNETVEALREALGALTERQRIVLDLYYREELQMHEIGDVLGVTESRVSQIRSAAIKHLRTSLGKGATQVTVAAA